MLFIKQNIDRVFDPFASDLPVFHAGLCGVQTWHGHPLQLPPATVLVRGHTAWLCQDKRRGDPRDSEVFLRVTLSNGFLSKFGKLPFILTSLKTVNQSYVLFINSEFFKIGLFYFPLTGFCLLKNTARVKARFPLRTVSLGT